MKAVVAAFNHYPTRAFSVIVQLHRLIDLRHDCRCACHELGPAPDLWALFYLNANSARCGDTLVHIPCTARNAAVSHANTHYTCQLPYTIYLEFFDIATFFTTLKLEPLLNPIYRYLTHSAHPPYKYLVCVESRPVCLWNQQPECAM